MRFCLRRSKLYSLPTVLSVLSNSYFCLSNTALTVTDVRNGEEAMSLAERVKQRRIELGLIKLKQQKKLNQAAILGEY